jgi:Catalytic LigB subunit of aromatic ring-opening dioxygenase
MAKIVLGMATSHGPLLSTPPEQWGERVKADRANPALWFRGAPYKFDALEQLRLDEKLAQKVELAERQARYDRCRKALAAMAATFETINPDVVVIVGNDQQEVFCDKNMPAFSIYWGESVTNRPPTEEQIAKMPPGSSLATFAHRPEKETHYPCAPDLGRHIIQKMMEKEFDVGTSKALPSDGLEWSRGSLPHAFGFILRQIMKDRPVPHLPVMINTFYPPNQPTAQRCHRFGLALKHAIESFPKESRVAVIASGGLSHFVVDEELDEKFLAFLKAGDVKGMTTMPETFLQSGTSEFKNWIPVGAIAHDAGLAMDVVDYVPCYRSSAGTGNAMGFVRWM